MLDTFCASQVIIGVCDDELFVLFVLLLCRPIIGVLAMVEVMVILTVMNATGNLYTYCNILLLLLFPVSISY